MTRGYPNLVLDPRAAFRTDFFPGLGWMMDKDLWEELRDRWAARCPNERPFKGCGSCEWSEAYRPKPRAEDTV